MVGFGERGFPCFYPHFEHFTPVAARCLQLGAARFTRGAPRHYAPESFSRNPPLEKHGEELGERGWAHPRRAPLFSCLHTSCVRLSPSWEGKIPPQRLGYAAGARSRIRPSSSCPFLLPAPSDVLPAAGRDPAAEGRALAEGHTDPTATAGTEKLTQQPEE